MVKVKRYQTKDETSEYKNGWVEQVYSLVEVEVEVQETNLVLVEVGSQLTLLHKHDLQA